MKVSVEDGAQDLLDRLSAQAAVQDPFARLCVAGVYEISLQKISVRDLKVKYLFSSIKKMSE